MASLLGRFLGVSSAATIMALRAFPFSGERDIVAKAREEAELAELRARQRIAEADAAAREAKLKAEADKLKAEADKLKAEAAEATNRADKVKAEAAEATNRADKLKAEAAEATNRAAEVAARTESSATTARDFMWARRALAGAVLGAAVLGGLFLACDHYTHHNRAYLRRRIRKVLVAGPKESLLPDPPPPSSLPLPPFPLEESTNRPLLVLGASGSGKSTQLGELAREFKKKGVPAVYFRFRSNREVAARHMAALGQDPLQSPQEGASEAPTLTVAAQRFCHAVGYPERPSYWSRWRMNRFKLSSEGAELSVSPVAVKARFKDAISDLFAVCGELYQERKADESIPVPDKKPVVLSDELHDLLHDRFNSQGGKDVFVHFGNEMTHACTDDRVSRVVLAASGSELLDKLDTLTPAGGDRVFPYMQPDPPESAVRERLTAKGYDPATVDAIIATCGTRVRLLTPFLESRLTDPSSTLERLRQSAERRLVTLMARCPEKAERDVLIKLLDKLAESSSSGELVERFPKAVQDPFPNRVLLRRVNDTATFQTEAVRQAWNRVRGNYV
jgi:hypothetical protein